MVMAEPNKIFLNKKHVDLIIYLLLKILMKVSFLTNNIKTIIYYWYKI